LGGTGQGGLAEQLLLHAVRVHHGGLGEVALVPVERGRRDGDAVAGPDALVAVQPRPEHRYSTPSRRANAVASPRDDAPILANISWSFTRIASSVDPTLSALSAEVMPSVSSPSSRRSSSSRAASAPFPSAPVAPAVTGPTRRLHSLPIGPRNHRTRISSSTVRWAVMASRFCRNPRTICCSA